MQPLLLPGVDVFQVVFTIPDALSSLTLGNRRSMFRLLFQAAWRSLKTVIENEQQFEAAAAMVLHTWNQHLESHVHLHAVVPGGRPSLQNPEQWKSATPPPHQRQDRWWLVDANDLRREFRTRFLSGLRTLHSRGDLKLDGDWSSQHRERYLEQCRRLRAELTADHPDISEPGVIDAAACSVELCERPCPTCGHGLERLESVHRTSWRDIFNSDDRPAWYRIKDRGG